MRRFTLVYLTLALAGCGGAGDQASTTTDSAALAPAAPPGMSLGDVAGTWNMQVVRENSASVMLTYQLNATADPAGWSMKFADRPDPVPVQVVSVAGDSIVIHAGPYPSALRKGVTVTTDGVSRLQNGMLVGRTTAHYSAGPDTVLMLRTQGTRAQ